MKDAENFMAPITINLFLTKTSSKYNIAVFYEMISNIIKG